MNSAVAFRTALSPNRIIRSRHDSLIVRTNRFACAFKLGLRGGSFIFRTLRGTGVSLAGCFAPHVADQLDDHAGGGADGANVGDGGVEQLLLCIYQPRNGQSPQKEEYELERTPDTLLTFLLPYSHF